jgi:hypothetical protein
LHLESKKSYKPFFPFSRLVSFSSEFDLGEFEDYYDTLFEGDNSLEQDDRVRY